MISRHTSVFGLIATAFLAALALSGCRAFQPEAVIVNKTPETFIIGAPLEHSGGYYHFHVYWYGSDADGTVERFVWALTDTTLQDPDTVADEEDPRFNPALDVSTLEIGHWTTRTDSIFNFTIDDGMNTAAHMTLHIVAVDDFGDFDRTPARLHFFSNTLGNPEINFFRVEEGGDVALAPGAVDTVGFGFPYEVRWAGMSPNIRSYDPVELALIDTVPPFDDGLFGYKWQIEGALGGDCIPSLQDCWQPRKFVEATGDSASYFGMATAMRFENDGSGSSPFLKLLESGMVSIQVNSIDVAGVEVASFMRKFSFVVNYDPETLMLDGETDWAHPEDTQEYPYYIRLNDPTQTRHSFASGQRIPDRTYVVVKALARDDPRDGRLDEVFKVGISGFVKGQRTNYFGGAFSFTSEASELNTDPPWDAGDTGWYGDTLGFLTAPNSRFTISMQAQDEHGRKDGSPATLSFDVGYPPCVQCVEVLPKDSSPSAFNASVECVTDLDNLALHPCFGDTTELRISREGYGSDELQYVQDIFMLVDKSTGFVRLADNSTGEGLLNYVVNARLYRMSILLHSLDDERERWSQPLNRSMGWQYQVSNVCDIYNQILDGGGNDDINQPTWGEPDDGIGLRVDPATGLWRLSVDVAVPADLLTYGPDDWQTLLAVFNPPDAAELIFASTTTQFGLGWVEAVALDQSNCDYNPVRPCVFNLFRKVRPPVAELLSGTWRDEFLPSAIATQVKNSLDLSQGAMASLDGMPVRKYFRLTVSTAAGDFTCSR